MVQSTVSSTLIGGMRMQFWRDLVEDVFEVRPSPSTAVVQC